MKLFWFFRSAPAASAQTRDQAASLTSSRLILWVSFLTVVIFVAWAYFAEIDQITRAPGAVIASSRTQIIQSQEGGTLESLKV